MSLILELGVGPFAIAVGKEGNDGFTPFLFQHISLLYSLLDNPENK